MSKRNLDDIEFARIVLAFSDWVTKWRDPACADRLARFRLGCAVRTNEIHQLSSQCQLYGVLHSLQGASMQHKPPSFSPKHGGFLLLGKQAESKVSNLQASRSLPE